MMNSYVPHTANLFLAMLSAMLLTSQGVDGRVGETKKQCADRYGNPRNANHKWIWIYQKNEVKIEIIFLNDVAIGMHYIKIGDAVPAPKLGHVAIKALLKANGGNQGWVPSGKNQWQTEDKSLTALGGDHLYVYDTEKFETYKKARELDDVEGL